MQYTDADVASATPNQSGSPRVFILKRKKQFEKAIFFRKSGDSFTKELTTKLMNVN